MATNRAVGLTFFGALRFLGLVFTLAGLALSVGDELNNTLEWKGYGTLLGWKLLRDVWMLLNALADGAETTSIAMAIKSIIIVAAICGDNSMGTELSA
mmetsp:Transcript_21716/g.39252  ORF Transcript_21716/g.39252 Transcript_21716/m.39252 type:complete len:98 (-) Transcript_21716:92-385(-)